MRWQWPWNDRTGQLSPLKLAVFAGALTPGLILALTLATGNGGAKPTTYAIHTTGDWAIRFLIITLAVTPFRRIAQWPRLIGVRRMLGLTALGYAAAHLMLYVVDQAFDISRVASEIVLRIYLLIGFTALVGLVALGATSTDAMIRRLGPNWQRLHRVIYAIAILGIIHFFMQTKLDVFQATMLGGFLILLFIYRLMARRRIALSPVNLAAAALLGIAGTMAIEYLWYALATNVPPARVFNANFAFGVMIRPAWWVGAAGLGVAFVAFLRSSGGEPAPARRQRA